MVEAVSVPRRVASLSRRLGAGPAAMLAVLLGSSCDGPVRTQPHQGPDARETSPSATPSATPNTQGHALLEVAASLTRPEHARGVVSVAMTLRAVVGGTARIAVRETPSGALVEAYEIGVTDTGEYWHDVASPGAQLPPGGFSRLEATHSMVGELQFHMNSREEVSYELRLMELSVLETAEIVSVARNELAVPGSDLTRSDTGKPYHPVCIWSQSVIRSDQPLIGASRAARGVLSRLGKPLDPNWQPTDRLRSNVHVTEQNQSPELVWESGWRTGETSGASNQRFVGRRLYVGFVPDDTRETGTGR